MKNHVSISLFMKWGRGEWYTGLFSVRFIQNTFHFCAKERDELVTRLFALISIPSLLCSGLFCRAWTLQAPLSRILPTDFQLDQGSGRHKSGGRACVWRREAIVPFCFRLWSSRVGVFWRSLGPGGTGCFSSIRRFGSRCRLQGAAMSMYLGPGAPPLESSGSSRLTFSCPSEPPPPFCSFRPYF